MCHYPIYCMLQALLEGGGRDIQKAHTRIPILQLVLQTNLMLKLQILNRTAWFVILRVSAPVFKHFMNHNFLQRFAVPWLQSIHWTAQGPCRAADLYRDNSSFHNISKSEEQHLRIAAAHSLSAFWSPHPTRLVKFSVPSATACIVLLFIVGKVHGFRVRKELVGLLQKR